MSKSSARNRAFEAAISIIEARQKEVRAVHDEWCRKYPIDAIGAATERAAYMDCELLARLIRERMSPARKATEGDAP